MFLTLPRVLTLVSIASSAIAQAAYANDFIDPDYILANKFGAHTQRARESIVSRAQQLAGGGPWSVVTKNVTVPSGKKHDYLSWAPYWWPDCSDAGNTTALTDEQVWTTCTYVNRDGQFNPDRRLVNDVGHFEQMSEAVLYNTLAWALNTMSASQKATFEANTVKFIRAWFLDPDTAMNPNLDYGQLQRGPDGQLGSHTGILDLKGMAKITSAILLLRKGGSTAWTRDLDGQMIEWSSRYITWLETANIAVEEAEATNNHGSFYFNQLAALKLLVNDIPGAKTATDTYFNGIYMGQITASGEQPLEASRTRPYHYRSYNLAAMITNARISTYADAASRAWNHTTDEGATIKSALDFAMTISASTSGENKDVDELYPNIAAVASVYGDADGKYLKFLQAQYPTFMAEPFMLWNQPFAEGDASGVVSSVASGSASSAGGPASPTGAVGVKETNGGGRRARFVGARAIAYMSVLVVMVLA